MVGRGKRCAESGVRRRTCASVCFEGIMPGNVAPRDRAILGAASPLEVYPFRNIWSLCVPHSNTKSFVGRHPLHNRCLASCSKCEISYILSTMCQSKHYNSFVVLESKSECTILHHQFLTVPSANGQSLYPNGVRFPCK